MGLLRRIFGGGEAKPEEPEEPETDDEAQEPEGDVGARIDAARDRLREEIAPLDQDDG